MSKTIVGTVRAIMLLALFYVIARSNYLLFHSLVEVFCVVVAVTIGFLAWNARDFLRNPCLVLLGIAYFFIGFLDLMHTLSYEGLPIFPHQEFAANKIWIATRFMDALSLLGGFLILRRGWKVNLKLVVPAYALATALILASIFVWDIFPACFIRNQGQTTFKIVGEYVVIAIVMAAILALKKVEHHFDAATLPHLHGTLILTILSELSFTLYTDNYGITNVLGHLAKLAAYWLLYHAVVQKSVREPQRILFKEVHDANLALTAEVAHRRSVEEQLARKITELREAMEQVHTLAGLLPMCAWCKKIRDDRGYWNSVEAYLKRHAPVEFTHGICPECRTAFLDKDQPPAQKPA